MDTIQISIILNESKLMGCTPYQLQEIRQYINSITSPYGYRYCDCLEVSTKWNFIVKISYPRFFAGINAFLISNRDECMKVEMDFSYKIMGHQLLIDAKIKLDRVDIPFTYYMNPNYSFNSYKKVFQIFDYVYRKKNLKSNPKAYTNIKDFKAETLIYSDTPTMSGYNKKIMIYDQYSNLKTKTINESDLYNFDAKYEGLQNRMRIEVSKRIDRLAISIQEFSNYRIFEKYVPQYREYILQNILSREEIDCFYNEKSIELAQKLLAYKEEANNFIYESFIYKEIENIYDYEIIRRALKICIENAKTREKAITAIRKVLFNYQLNENMEIMETYSVVMNIRSVIEQSFQDVSYNTFQIF